MNKNRLGTDPLLGVIKGIKEQEEQASNKNFNVIDNKKIRLVSLSYVFPDPEQPRKDIDPSSEEILELAESIKKHGFINFITVREVAQKEYVIVAGERRFTAAKIAGLKKIPVMVIAEERDPVDYALMQIEENLQRKNLTPFEEAEAYEKLRTEHKLKRQDIVALVKKNKSYVSKMMRLNKISLEIREDEKIANVARDVLWQLATHSEEDQISLWQRIRNEPIGSSLKKAEKFLEDKREENKEKNKLDPEEIWGALKKAVKKDKGIILNYITPKKAVKLLEEYGD